MKLQTLRRVELRSGIRGIGKNERFKTKLHFDIVSRLIGKQSASKIGMRERRCLIVRQLPRLLLQKRIHSFYTLGNVIFPLSYRIRRKLFTAIKNAATFYSG